MPFRNQILKVPYEVDVPHPKEPGFRMIVDNPDVQKLRDGTFRPPEGWRALSVITYSNGYILLLEQEILDHPYR